MKRQVLLKQFDYSVPASSVALVGLKRNQVTTEHLPLMMVSIDFENGLLKLDGDWKFMMSSNAHNEVSWFDYHTERVKIETAIYPGSVIDLNDPENDGLIFSLGGSITDDNCTGECSGLLVVDKACGNNDLTGDEWNISFYLYDLQFEECEIKFKLPVYDGGMNQELN